MATELAVQQTLNEKNKPTNADMTDEVKDQSSKIDLANEMRVMSDKDKYGFNYRLCFMLPFTFLLFVSWFVESYVLKIVYFALLLILLCSAISIVCMIIKKPFKKSINTLFGFVSSNNPNDNYNESDVLVVFEQRQYAGLWLFASIVYASVVAIIDETNEETYDFDSVGEIRISIQTRVIPLALNIVFFVFFKTVKCHEKIMEQKKLVLGKYKNTEKIQRKIKERLQDWQKSKQLINRKIEFSVVCVVIFFYHFILTAIIDWDIYNNHDLPVAILITIIFLLDCCFLVFIMYFVNTIYLHYKFPSIIMDELAAPIHSETTNDLIGWWELRKFYAQYIVKIYTSSLSVYIAAVIFASIIVTLFLFASILGQGFDIENLTIGMALCWFILVMFLVVSNATDYHANQLSHANMLCIESIALRKYKADNINSINDIYDIELRKYENDIQQFIINQLIHDVENNSDVIHVLGISIDSNFMLLLRAALGTLVIAIISVLFS